MPLQTNALMFDRLHHSAKTSLITVKNQVSNHLLVGGFVANLHSIVVQVLSSMTQQLQMMQDTIVLPTVKV